MHRNNLLVLSAVLCLLTTKVIGQNPPTVTQEAKASPCSNIVALTGDVKIDCSSLTPAQQKIIENIPSLLRKVIAHQFDADAVIAKLDDCLKTTNPNLAPKVYRCDGLWRTVGPGAQAMLELNSGGDATAFNEMIRLYNGRQVAELLKTCSAAITSMPEWLTPRLFCGLAYLGSGDKINAQKMLAEFESRTGPSYDAPECKQMAGFLRKNLE